MDQCAVHVIKYYSHGIQELTTTLERRARAYGMERSAEKSKVVVNSRIAPRTTLLMNEERLEEVISFKFSGRSSHQKATPQKKCAHG